MCFQQFETHCFPVFSGRLRHLVSLHFPADWRTMFPFIFHQVQIHCFLEYFGRLKHFVSLCFRQFGTHCFPAFFSRLRHLVSLHFPADWNTLFTFIFHQVQTHCLLEYFGRLKHFVYLYFTADSNTLFPCISRGFKHLLSFYFWQIETSCKHCHCQGQVKTWGTGKCRYIGVHSLLGIHIWVHIGIHIGVHIGIHIGVHIGTHIGCHMKNVINSTQSSSRSSPANCLKSPVTATNLTWDRSQGSTDYVFDHISLREVRLRLNTQSVVVFLLFSFTQISHVILPVGYTYYILFLVVEGLDYY